MGVFSRPGFFSQKWEEGGGRGFPFHHPPQTHPGGAISTCFEDVDGNLFTLLCSDEMTWEVEEQRRAHEERLGSERHPAQEREVARQAQARPFPQPHPTLPPLQSQG